MTNTIVDIHRASRRSYCYGSPRVHDELHLGVYAVRRLVVTNVYAEASAR